MKVIAAMFSALIAAAATDASAQPAVIDLSGQFQCIQGCVAGFGGLAHVAQNGWQLNLVNEAGDPTRAWVDWPGHIWAERWNEGAIYSPDGLTIQFDRGTVWRRVVEVAAPPPPPPPPVRHKKRRPLPAPNS